MRPPDGPPHGGHPTDDPSGVHVARVIDRSVEQLWATIERLERLQPRNVEEFRVSIFGASRLDATDPLYAEVRELAHRLAEAGCQIVTGGGSGVMQAANEGASGGVLTEPAREGGLPVRLVAGEGGRPFVQE
ncbi:MAG TPA: LOG family protein, partial [Acidobacteria bacterium]|nr:LOG family protein [Acidobacteriota bacterium]